MNELNLEPPRIRQSFDRAATSYDQAAALQRQVVDELLNALPASVHPHHILDAGCGTGYGSAALSARFPQAQLLGLDLAPGMLTATRQRMRLPLVCADVQALPLAAGSMDFVWSSLMLQWCNEPVRAFANFRHCLQFDGTLAFSTFGPDTLHELRDSFSDGHTHVSRFPPAEELAAQLMQAGFIDVVTGVDTLVLHYPEVRALMQELKAIGAHNATSGRPRGLTGRQGWQKMLARYETLRGEQGLPATYEIIYVQARAA